MLLRAVPAPQSLAALVELKGQPDTPRPPSADERAAFQLLAAACSAGAVLAPAGVAPALLSAGVLFAEAADDVRSAVSCASCV
jgi:hypothetical protein